MSETAPEHPGISNAGSILTRKFAGIPAWVILLGAAGIAYLYFSHKNAAAQTQGLKTTGGGGTARTGKVVVQRGAVSINVRQVPRGGGDDDDMTDNDQPGHHPPPRKKHHSTSRPNPYDVPHGPRKITESQARYAISHNRPVYTKGGKNGWTKQSSTKSGDQYYVGGEVYDWLRDVGQIKGANQGA
ncbi:MAG TPA: hypothetical protein VGR89_01350 [Puia sp.]|nr:hypothetical protein [Puia sp.]